MKVVPRPGVDATLTVPPDWSTIPYTVASPSPEPLPASLVVKNGSKMCCSVAGSMPVPVSLTLILVHSPAAAASPCGRDPSGARPARSRSSGARRPASRRGR